jgi:hypothetical protein
MDPLTIIMGLLGLGKTVGGVVGLGQSNRVPGELQGLYDELKKQSTEGLGGEKSSMLASGASGLARQATGAQARGSMALASRGTGNSSAADSMLADISTAQAQGYSDLVAQINSLDQQMKMSAKNSLRGVVGDMNSIRTAKQTAAGNMLGEGISSLINPQTWGIQSDSEKNLLEMIKKLLSDKNWTYNPDIQGTAYEPNLVS